LFQDQLLQQLLKHYLRMNRKKKKMTNGLIFVFICVLLSSVGQILWKYGMNSLGGIKLSEVFSLKLFSTFFHPFIFLGLLCYVFSTILWLVAISMFEVSYVYPLISLGYVLTTFFAMFFLKENISFLRWSGVLFIVIGCFLIIKS
jgi:drug/metabolite transporter (DMT)-like permease